MCQWSCAKDYEPWKFINRSQKVLPGSTIIVGEKPERLQKEKEEIDWEAFGQGNFGNFLIDSRGPSHATADYSNEKIVAILKVLTHPHFSVSHYY